MPGGWTMSMMWMRMPGQTWFTSAGMFLLMWLAMMVAMMLPSAMPMLGHCHRCLKSGGMVSAGAATMLVACGYFAVWTVIGLVMYLVGVSWAYATMQWSGLSRAVPAMVGATLVVSGGIQFSRWKMDALKRCRDPLTYAALKTVGAGKNAWWHGLSQGVSCAICCSGPMLALLALGAMNLTVMVVVALQIAMERLAPKPDLLLRLSGTVAIIIGAAKMFRPVFLP